MATADSVKAKLQGLLDAANAATGNSDTTLTAAVNNLIAGYGQNGGGFEVDTSMNLHDSSTDIANVYINTSGSEVTYNGWSATDYIPLVEGRYYAMKANNIDGKYCSFYNSSKAHIAIFNGVFGNIQSSDADSYVVFKAIGSYIRLSATTSGIAAIKIHSVI